MLFAIDFDHTIADGHTHNIITAQIKAENAAEGKSATKEAVNKQWDLVKDLPPIGGAEKWKETVTAMLNEGHEVAIVSFSAYGKDIIPRYLEEVIGLKKEEVGKIKVVSWMPNHPPREDIPSIDPNIANKNNHIKLAIEETGFKGPPEEVIVIDDQDKNITEAAKHYTTIVADDKASHLDQIAIKLAEKKQAKQDDVNQEIKQEEIKQEVKNIQTVELTAKPTEKKDDAYARIAFAFPNPEEEKKFVQSLEEYYEKSSSEEKKSPLTYDHRDPDSIILNDSKKRPLASYDKTTHELSMLKPNPGVGDYVQVLKAVVKALAKTVFGKIKAFFSPNKKEKDPMQQALNEMSHDPLYKSTFQERAPASPVMTDHQIYLRELIIAKTVELSARQAEIKSIDDHLKHGYKEEMRNYFKENTPPALYAKMLPLQEKYLTEMEKPLKLPNAIDEKFFENHKNNLDNTMENFKKELTSQIQTEKKNMPFPQGFSPADPKEAYQEEIKQLRAKTKEAVNKEYFEPAGWSRLQTKLISADKQEKILKSATNDYLFAKTPEETSEAEAKIKPYFIDTELTLKGFKPTDRETRNFEEYMNNLSKLKTDYQNKSQGAKDLYRAEKEAQAKYLDSSQQLYNEISQIPEKQKALFSIENNFQQKIDQLHKEHDHKKINQAYQDRNNSLNNLKSLKTDITHDIKKQSNQLEVNEENKNNYLQHSQNQ